MATYTIRAGSIFTITKDDVLYTAGDEVDLDDREFEIHKHKLEGVNATVEDNQLKTGQ